RQPSDGFLFEFQTYGGNTLNALLESAGIRDDVPDIGTETKPAKRMIEFYTPSELTAFIPPEGFKLVGDYHIQKAAPFVMGGAPGVGKSRAAVALAVAGATGTDWLGFKVHRQFKTMIVQAENGRV